MSFCFNFYIAIATAIAIAIAIAYTVYIYTSILGFHVNCWGAFQIDPFRLTNTLVLTADALPVNLADPRLAAPFGQQLGRTSSSPLIQDLRNLLMTARKGIEIC